MLKGLNDSGSILLLQNASTLLLPLIVFDTQVF